MSDRQIITRAEAKAQGLLRYFTGKACVHGHVDGRYTSNGECAACKAENTAKVVASGENAARSRRYREANPEKVREANRRWRAANPERKAARDGWTNAVARGAVLPAEFPDVAALILATTPLYVEARRRTEETGTAFEVDHILPIERGGQHRMDNLRVVPASFNSRKKALTDCEVLERIDAGRWTGDAALAVAIASPNCPNHQPGQLALSF